jgi:LysM repeat protein
MKKSIITTSLIALAVSAFSVGAQAKPNLSITSISEAQANAMRSQGVSRGSSISTTVTIGGKNVQSRRYRRVRVEVPGTSQVARQKWLAKSAVKRVPARGPQYRWVNKAKVFKHAVAMHEVSKGDTLYKIAKRYNTTVERIMRINQLRSTTIHVGQMIKV